MKRYGKLTLFLLLVIAAFASVALALRPLMLGMERASQIRQDTRRFQQTRQEILEEAEELELPIPYEQLYEAMQQYNAQLYAFKQEGLDSKRAYEDSPFRLTLFGLPDETFGLIQIPKMELEMPLYLGASEENMANGAAVLSQTSIPLGGENTNAVIAGHRGWNGYAYFKNIEDLEVGDEVIITNLWRTLTYTVSEIKIVYPDDVDAILIRPGRDMVTLLTCHPYASGGKYRYLVFCDRKI